MWSWVQVQFGRFRAGERGAAAAEYALVLALVVIALVAALTALGGTLKAKINEIIAGLQ